jgi:hypothetical protein
MIVALGVLGVEENPPSVSLVYVNVACLLLAALYYYSSPIRKQEKDSKKIFVRSLEEHETS